MQVTSLSFAVLTAFVLVVYYLLPRRPQNAWLLVVSYAFCATWAWHFALVLLVVTTGNFLLASSVPRVGEEAARAETCRIRDGLAERGILVRDVSGYPGLAGCFRIGVGCGRALRATRQALEEVLS